MKNYYVLVNFRFEIEFQRLAYGNDIKVDQQIVDIIKEFPGHFKNEFNIVVFPTSIGK